MDLGGKLKTVLGTAMTFGKKNKTSLMTGTSILLGWGAGYLFWRQSKKAEEVIKQQETDSGEDLEKKEKFLIYLKYCWMSLAMGVGSTGLTIWAHELDMGRITELVLLSKFLEDKNEDQEKLIEKMKGEMKKGGFERIQEEIREEKYPKEELKKDLPNIPGDGRTLFIDETNNGAKFKSNVETVKNAIWAFNSYADTQFNQLKRRRLGDAFYSSDNPFPNMDIGLYVEIPMSKFLDFIGESTKNPIYEDSIGYGMVFRYSGGGMCVNPESVMEYDDFIDPDTGDPKICYLHYYRLLRPNSDLMDEMP